MLKDICCEIVMVLVRDMKRMISNVVGGIGEGH